MRFRSSFALGITATVVALSPAVAAGGPDVADGGGARSGVRVCGAGEPGGSATVRTWSAFTSAAVPCASAGSGRATEAVGQAVRPVGQAVRPVGQAVRPVGQTLRPALAADHALRAAAVTDRALGVTSRADRGFRAASRADRGLRGIAGADRGLRAASGTGRVPHTTPAAPGHPTCTSVDAAEFPLVTRIHPGPGAYEVGGEPQDWTLDLTNSTDGTCGNIHPVLVLVDEERALKARHVQVEFGDGARQRDVRFQRTGEGENVGVFGDDDGSPGFTVGPGRTVSVKVRLSFAPGAEPNHVVASAAVVQRRDDDGDWVGASNDYPFDIVPEGTVVPSATAPSAGRLQELAETGAGTPLGVGITAGAALLGLGALAVGARRLRAGRR